MKRANLKKKKRIRQKTKHKRLNVHTSGIPIRDYPVGIPDESSASEKYNGSGRHAEMFCKLKEF